MEICSFPIIFPNPAPGVRRSEEINSRNQNIRQTQGNLRGVDWKPRGILHRSLVVVRTNNCRALQILSPQRSGVTIFLIHVRITAGSIVSAFWILAHTSRLPRRIWKVQHTDKLTQTEIHTTCIRVKAKGANTLAWPTSADRTPTPDFDPVRDPSSPTTRAHLFFVFRTVRRGASNEYDFGFFQRDRSDPSETRRRPLVY